MSQHPLPTAPMAGGGDPGHAVGVMALAMSQTDKTQVRLALIASLALAIIPAIASARPGLHAKASTSSRASNARPFVYLPTAYPVRTFWDGGEAGRLAYLASLHRWRARSAARPEQAPLRRSGGGGGGSYSGRPDWIATADCESGGNWAINTSNGYWGGLQFTPHTWFAYGGGPFDGVGPFPYSAAEQIAVAARVFLRQGPGAWPSCFQRK